MPIGSSSSILLYAHSRRNDAFSWRRRRRRRRRSQEMWLIWKIPPSGSPVVPIATVAAAVHSAAIRFLRLSLGSHHVFRYIYIYCALPLPPAIIKSPRGAAAAAAAKVKLDE